MEESVTHILKQNLFAFSWIPKGAKNQTFLPGDLLLYGAQIFRSNTLHPLLKKRPSLLVVSISFKCYKPSKWHFHGILRSSVHLNSFILLLENVQHPNFKGLLHLTKNRWEKGLVFIEVKGVRFLYWNFDRRRTQVDKFYLFASLGIQDNRKLAINFVFKISVMSSAIRRYIYVPVNMFLSSPNVSNVVIRKQFNCQQFFGGLFHGCFEINDQNLLRSALNSLF